MTLRRWLRIQPRLPRCRPPQDLSAQASSFEDVARFRPNHPKLVELFAPICNRHDRPDEDVLSEVRHIDGEHTAAAKCAANAGNLPAALNSP